MTVIELHRSPNSSGEGDWKKEEIGVLCLVQDLHKKCYFFRIFCLLRKRIVWEYEINKSMRYSTPKSFLHSFQAEVNSWERFIAIIISFKILLVLISLNLLFLLRCRIVCTLSISSANEKQVCWQFT